MANKLAPSPFTVNGSSTKVIDFDLRGIKTPNVVLIIVSNVNLTLTLKDGIGVADTNASNGDLPYVVDGSSVPVFDGTGASYSITGGTNEEIVLTRGEMAEWLRASFQNATGGAATVSIYARL